MVRSKFLVLAIFGLMLAGAANAAVIPLVDGTWHTFFWTTVGPIDDNADGYQATVPVGFTGLLRVVDCCLIGDEFQVFQNPGGLAFNTSAFGGVDGAGTTGFDGDSAWLVAELSKGSKIFGDGSWEIDISVSRLALGAPSGAGFIRLDLLPIPEPATYAFVGAGLLALVGFARRRKT